MSDFYYSATNKTMLNSSNEHFYLHTHNKYEIYMFLEGDSKYIVEEKNYNLSPGDIIIIRKNEMHRVFHNRDTKYRRFVLMVSPEFFKQYSCEQYENAFSSNFFGGKNKINSEIVHSSGLYDAIMRLEKYSDNYTSLYSPVVCSIVIEILYLINQVSLFEAPTIESPLIKNIISYINDNLKNEITLDELSKQFFISKYHMCHAFKKSTGLTIHEYIKQKRLIIASELIKEGQSLTKAAITAGFSDYSSFYRAYVKRYNTSPKNCTKHPLELT